MTAAPEIKAVAFNSAVVALRAMSEGPFERFVGLLTPETAALVKRPPLSVAYVPAELYAELLRTGQRELFGGDDTPLEEAGRRAIAHDLRGVYKMFVRLLSPATVMERGSKLWEQYGRNRGTMVVRRMGDQGLEIAYDQLAPTLAFGGFWAYVRGSVRGAAEATGLKSVRVETASGGGTAAHCRLHVTW